MYGVVPESLLAPTSPYQLPPDSVHTITSARAGYDVWVSGRFVIYISRLWYMEGKIRWHGWATGNLFKIRHPRAMFTPAWIWMEEGNECSCLAHMRSSSADLFPFCSASAHPPSVRPEKGGMEGSFGWIRSPSLSSSMHRATKSHCLQSCWGRWGSTCKSACFYSFFPQNSSKEINWRLLPSEGRQLPALAWLNIQTQLAAHMTARAVRDAQFVPEGPPLIVEAAPPE